MATVGADGGSLQADSQPKAVRMVWGLAAAWCSVCIHRMNQVNSCIGPYHDDSTSTLLLLCHWLLWTLLVDVGRSPMSTVGYVWGQLQRRSNAELRRWHVVTRGLCCSGWKHQVRSWARWSMRGGR